MKSRDVSRNGPRRHRRRSHQRGASVVEYLLLVGLIAMCVLTGWALVGEHAQAKEQAQAACVTSLACSAEVAAPAVAGKAGVGSAAEAIDSGGTQGGGFFGGAWSFGKGFVGQAWDTITGLAQLVMHPVDTVRGLASAVAHPIETVSAIKDSVVAAWHRDPAEALGRAAFEIATLPAAAGKLGKLRTASSASRAAAPIAHELSNFEKVGREILAAGSPWAREQLNALRVTTPFGKKVNELARRSDNFAVHISSLLEGGWTFRYGRPFGGTYIDRAAKEIVIDRLAMFSTVSKTRSLAHEVGHAVYGYEFLGGPRHIGFHPIQSKVRENGNWVERTISKEEFVAKNLAEKLKDEGAATVYNAQVRADILEHGGVDIGVSGANDKVASVLSDYFDGKIDRESARVLIGEEYKDFHPSTHPESTYKEAYSKPYLEAYEKFLRDKARSGKRL